MFPGTAPTYSFACFQSSKIHFRVALIQALFSLSSFTILSFPLGNLLLKSPSGKLNGKSSADSMSEKNRYQPDMQNTNMKAPAAYFLISIHTLGGRKSGEEILFEDS